MSPAKVLNSVVLSYTGGPVDILTGLPRYQNTTVNACVNGSVNTAPNAGLPCILSSQCYKRSTPGWTLDLDGDCEWTLINSENGTLKIQ